MTASIVAGWSLLGYTLGAWSDLGYIEGTIAGMSLRFGQPCAFVVGSRTLTIFCIVASGLYALAFGLLGLIPAPKVHRD